MAIPKSFIKRVASVCFILALFLSTSAFSQSCPAQGIEIFPDLNGQVLIDSLIANYKTTSVLSYNAAREEMYGDIDNFDGIVEGIYTGYQGAIDPNSTENPRLQAVAVDINAEHSWPQSKGATSGTLAHSDMHHLYPAYESANSSRGNHPFAEVPDDQTVSWWRNDSQVFSPNYEFIDEYSERREGHPSGQNHPNGEEYDSWEPREDAKGDIARSMFYFYTMYKDQADAADPIFFEVQKEFLRAWNSYDTVSQKEYDRTCAIAGYQSGKVNPFVIDPTLAARAYFEGEISQTNVQFTASVFSVNEGIGEIQISLAISNPNPDTATTVDVAYTGGTATPGEDFETFTTQTVTFPEGSLDQQSVTLTLIDDELAEQNENISLELQNVSGPNNVVIGQANSLEITVQDNDGDTPTSAWINEFHYDNDGGDTGEFVELAVNAQSADLTDITLTLYNGSNGTSYNTFSGTDFVQGETENGISFYYVDLPSNGLQNGSPDGMSLDLGGELIQFISYEGTFAAVDGPAQDIESTDIGAEQIGTAPIGSSLQLAGSGSEYNDFTWEYLEENTKGALNSGQDVEQPISNEDEPEIAHSFKLHQNYPNPFNPSTVISYQLSESSEVRLEIFDMMGRKVADLLNNERKSAGAHQVTFDAGNLSSGVYIYRISNGNGQQLTRKMLLMK
ncbi:MAG: endonuclease [Gracilimonas sp.]